MSNEYGSKRPLPPSSRALSNRAAIVGIGETDYHTDYQAQRSKAPGYRAPDAESLARTAFERALTDSGLSRDDIDGVSVSFTYGGPDARAIAAMLGLNPHYAIENGNIMAGPLPIVCADIVEGKADTVAMIYAVASRSMGRQYGGGTYSATENMPASYYYYHPWGWSSQAAHWAMMFSHYQQTYGASEADLGRVAMQIRQHASLNGNAVMQAPLTIEQYLASRYIVRPMHLFDLCLVNDGAVCLIVRRADLARDAAHTPVLVSGWSETKVKKDKMHAMVRDRLGPLMQDALSQAFAMTDLGLDDIGHFEGYDASTIHLVNQIEGFGFAASGEGLAFCADGQMTHGGRIPTNTGGGNLSGSYMHGWSQVVEVVRQLRHEAGARQVEGVRASLSALVQTDQAHPLLFTRGAN